MPAPPALQFFPAAPPHASPIPPAPARNPPAIPAALPLGIRLRDPVQEAAKSSAESLRSSAGSPRPPAPQRSVSLEIPSPSIAFRPPVLPRCVCHPQPRGKLPQIIEQFPALPAKRLRRPFAAAGASSASRRESAPPHLPAAEATAPPPKSSPAACPSSAINPSTREATSCAAPRLPASFRRHSSRTTSSASTSPQKAADPATAPPAQLHQSLPQRQQHPHQVPAVHARHVQGQKRPQRPRVVPVVKMRRDTAPTCPSCQMSSSIRPSNVPVARYPKSCAASVASNASIRCSSARFGARSPDAGIPGNCPAEENDPPAHKCPQKIATSCRAVHRSNS